MGLLVSVPVGNRRSKTDDVGFVEIPIPYTLISLPGIIKANSLGLGSGSLDLTGRDEPALTQDDGVRPVILGEPSFDFNPVVVALRIHRIGLTDSEGDGFSQVILNQRLENTLSL